MAISFMLPFEADGQVWKLRRYEGYFGLGTSNLYGDIGGALTAENAYGFKDIELTSTRPSLAFGAGYRLNHRFIVRSNFVVGFFAGNDIGSKNEFTRDYSYFSTVFEPTVQLQYFILAEDRGMSSAALYNRRGMINKIGQFFIYAFAGGGGVVNFPTVPDLDGNVITEDRYAKEGSEFQRVGLVFPVGVGVRYHVSQFVLANFEFGRRYTLTDYVDGYTSRYSTSNDVYDFTTFSLIYKIKTSRRGTPVLFNRLD